MSNEQLKDWRGFVITEEIRQGLIKKDKSAIDKFYLDNYDNFCRLALVYFRKHPMNKLRVEDLVDQLYLDLYYLNFSSASYFVYGVFANSFTYCDMGGYSYIIETNSKYKDFRYSNIYSFTFDKPIGDDGITLGDFMSSKLLPSFVNYRIAKRKELLINKILDFLKTILNPRELQYMEMYLYGYAHEYARREVGYKSTRSTFEIYWKLRFKYKEIIAYLSSLGYDLSYYAELIPDKIEEEKARKAARYQYACEYRKAKRLERQAQGV